MKSFFKWSLLTLVPAAVLHMVAVWVFPYAIMAMVAKKKSKTKGGSDKHGLRFPPDNARPAHRGDAEPGSAVFHHRL